MSNRKQLNEMVKAREAIFREQIRQANIALKRRQEMEANPDFQRRRRLGADGRRHEAVKILAKHIHERNHHGEADPSFSSAEKHAAQVAERVFNKIDRK